MSAYAALISLLQNLKTILDHLGGLRITHHRATLHSIQEKAILLLNFLENSSTFKDATQISAVETKIREAAYNAENAIESQISKILDSDSRSLSNVMKITFRYLLYLVFVAVSSSRIHVSFPEVIPVWIKISMIGIFTPALHGLVFPPAHETRELQRVLNDLNFIVKDVIKIKEVTSGYAALISLRQILDNTNYGSLSSHNRAHLQSLRQNVTFLLRFQENASSNMTSRKPELEKLDAAIRDAAFTAKDLLESHILVSEGRSLCGLKKVVSLLACLAIFIVIMLSYMNYQLIITSFTKVVRVCIQIASFINVASDFGALELCMGVAVGVLVFLVAINDSKAEMNQGLPLVIDIFNIIVGNAIKIMEACGNPNEFPAAAAAAASSKSDLGGSGKNVVVGLESDLEKIRDRLTRECSSKRELASIVGMGGIGKTTLARLVYNDPHTVYHFDVRAWVTVSQEYSLRNVLLCLLNSANMFTKEMQEDDDENKLGVYLHKSLMGRRYLIVMDDVWETQIWDSISIFLPENCNGSRVLMTSRLSNVARNIDSSCPIHQMQCLNEDDSWYLLREKVFGGESCPLELESIGREIARNCRGLPLAILVIGGLLYKDNQNKIWRDIAENLNSKLRQTEEECLEILGLSYKHLPHHLRPCFLYMGVFPRDCEIPVSKLINLWAAEGFLKPCTSKNIEEVAEDCLKELIERDMVLVCKQSCNGKIRTCSIHDLLRDVCVQNARKENFLHVVNSGGYVTREWLDQINPRRLSIHADALQVNPTHDLMSCYYNVHSFLWTASKLLNSPFDLYLGLLYLRVLDVVVVHFGEFPDQIIKLLRLRYLAFHYDGSLPPSMSKLQNLETIVHHHCSFGMYPLLPRVIWSMPNLRHLYLKPGCYLSDPLSFRLPWKSSILQHLQTLVGVRNFKWSKGIIKRIPNVKKLVISYNVASFVDWSTYQLESLVDLHQLESLKITIKYNDLGLGSTISNAPPKLAFPLKLKKLSLSGCGIPWTAIGALVNLEALKLRHEACSGPSWETVEGEFPQLIFLLLEEMHFTRWETEAAHFPRLQRLVIRSCGKLQEIPSAVGDIPTLEMMELDDCLPSAVDSAKEIQEEQESMGNEELIVRIGIKSW